MVLHLVQMRVESGLGIGLLLFWGVWWTAYPLEAVCVHDSTQVDTVVDTRKASNGAGCSHVVRTIPISKQNTLRGTALSQATRASTDAPLLTYPFLDIDIDR